MDFWATRFPRTSIAANGDSSQRFTSCCVSLEGNLTLVRVQDCMRLGFGLNRSAFWQATTAFSARTRPTCVTAETNCRHIDLQFVDEHGLHLVLWERGMPHMCGLFIPSIRDLRGLEAVGWFARQHELRLNVFLALVREVRTADETLPLFVTTFRAHSAFRPGQPEGDWRLLESTALWNVLFDFPSKNGAPVSLSACDDRPSKGWRVVLKSCGQQPAARLPCIDRLSGRFRCDEQ